jgi:hypothetical protein
MACRESNDVLNPVVEEDITTDEQRPGSCLDQAHEGRTPESKDARSPTMVSTAACVSAARFQAARAAPG